MCFFSPFSSLNDEKNCYKYYNKRTTTFDNGNVQSHDKKNVNWIVPLTQTVVLTHLHMTK